jgi:glycosyltransferase involved in cell wall biosynthesis
MPRFANMLVKGMRERGHTVTVWSPLPRFFKVPAPGVCKKWLGYLDQYVLFPKDVKSRLKSCPKDTLFVFADQALGPWVPLVALLPHVIHCHDFLAQRSAIGEINENPTGWTGKKYQTYIRRGYSKGKNFVSVSQKTRNDLLEFLLVAPPVSEVVYNGLNQTFAPGNSVDVRNKLMNKLNIDLSPGYLLHVGGNQWYKNRIGVVEIYNAWRLAGGCKIPLLMVGKDPDSKLKETLLQSPFKNDIYFRSGLDDASVSLAYAGASVFLFPSLAEGFGWPIAEAMASGCPVITTDEAPMTEVAGNAGFLIPRRPNKNSDAIRWANDVAKVLTSVLKLTSAEKSVVVDAGIENAKRFDPETALNKIESIYLNILHKK